MSPAIKGVQQAHGGGLALGGAGFDDGADEYLGDTTTDGVNDDGDEDADVRVGQEEGENTQACKSDGCKDMSGDDAGTVADLVYDLGTDEIHRELYTEIERNEQSQLGKWNIPRRLKRQ